MSDTSSSTRRRRARHLPLAGIPVALAAVVAPTPASASTGASVQPPMALPSGGLPRGGGGWGCDPGSIFWLDAHQPTRNYEMGYPAPVRNSSRIRHSQGVQCGAYMDTLAQSHVCGLFGCNPHTHEHEGGIPPDSDHTVTLYQNCREGYNDYRTFAKFSWTNDFVPPAPSQIHQSSAWVGWTCASGGKG